ncbi:hypothetical protein BVRB_4g084920 [Beta vulgaris subsp. vulgaris]|nr:hypothetical protein BVRB_4g084920 [Beta vulgaris subsp. vulgaris]
MNISLWQAGSNNHEALKQTIDKTERLNECGNARNLQRQWRREGGKTPPKVLSTESRIIKPDLHKADLKGMKVE